MIDRKMEPLIKRLMVKYLGEMEEDLIMFVVEHLKDHKGPQKLAEGLEPVRHHTFFAPFSNYLSGPRRRRNPSYYQRLASNYF